MRRRVISVTRRHLDFLFNREETVVSYEGAMCRCDRCCGRIPWDDTELQLPPSDESKVGDDV